LLEVNHSPSFTTDSPLDEKVKGEVIKDTITILGLSQQRKKVYQDNETTLMNFRQKNKKSLQLSLEKKEELRLKFD
jgi:tubulin polyglutamylase TTLL6/13